MKKYFLDDGFNIRFYFIVKCSGDRNWLPLKGECWLPFAPTIGLELAYNFHDYPAIKSLKYHVGTNKFTAYLEEATMYDYNEKDVLEYYTLCVKAGAPQV